MLLAPALVLLAPALERLAPALERLAPALERPALALERLVPALVLPVPALCSHFAVLEFLVQFPIEHFLEGTELHEPYHLLQCGELAKPFFVRFYLNDEYMAQ